MPHPYVRIGTPKITYVGDDKGQAIFRIHLASAERLDGLLFRGEIQTLLFKTGVEHRMGNSIPGVMLPENPKSKDFFLMLPLADIRVLTSAFEVTGYSPDLFA